jgi:hypothetical protein
MLDQTRDAMTPINQATSQPDLFWSAIDWAIRGAGALLLLILTVGWKDYRRNIKMITELHMYCKDFEKRSKQIDELVTAVARLEEATANLKGTIHGKMG